MGMRHFFVGTCLFVCRESDQNPLLLVLLLIRRLPDLDFEITFAFTSIFFCDLSRVVCCVE